MRLEIPIDIRKISCCTTDSFCFKIPKYSSIRNVSTVRCLETVLHAHAAQKLDCNHAPSIKNTLYPVHALRSLRCGSSEFFQSSRIVNFPPSSNWPNVSLALPILLPSFGPPATFIGVNSATLGLACLLVQQFPPLPSEHHLPGTASQ